MAASKASWKPVIALATILSLTVFGLANARLVGDEVACLVRWSKALGPWAAPLLSAISALMPVIMLPVFPLMALSGPLFTEMYGDWLMGGTVAFLAVFTGLWLGSVVAFALGKSVFKSYAEKAHMESGALKRINRLVDVGGTKIVLMARASPLLPAEVFDYACAVTNLRTRQYAIGCLGSAVPVAFWTYSSAQAAAAAHDRTAGNSAGGKIWLIVINAAALAALTALLVRMIGRTEAALVARSSPVLEQIRKASSWLPQLVRPSTPTLGEGPLRQRLLRAVSEPPPASADWRSDVVRLLV